MELFRGVNVDWLRLKWYFLGFSLIFSISGIVSMGWHWQHIGSPVPLGVDFRGGTEVQVQFVQAPDIGAIRQAMSASGIKDSTVESYDQASLNEVLIGLPEQHDESALETGQKAVMDALHGHYANPIVPSGTKVDVVGPTVGHQLEKQALLATLYSLLGMLVYLWFRFQLIYGVAAVVAVFHDTLITVGAFALTGQEISLTVIAAILTLVGYSMNDTIVVFDRIRENLRLEPPRVAARRRQSQHQSDPEPDRAHLRPYLPYRALALYFWRSGLERLFICACGGYSYRHVLVHRRGRAHVGGLAGVARKAGKDGRSTGRKAFEGLKTFAVVLHRFRSMFGRLGIVLVQGEHTSVVPF